MLPALRFEQLLPLAEPLSMELTHRTLRDHLASCEIPVHEETNKARIIALSLYNAQIPTQTGAPVARFLESVMRPMGYVGRDDQFQSTRDRLNEVLIHVGHEVTESGKVSPTRATASTLSEGAKLAGAIRTELVRRNTHTLLLDYCSEEIVSRSLFHAMAEASKSIPDRVRRATGLGGDGWILYSNVFGEKPSDLPRLFINGWRTDSERSEHSGFRSLLVGIHGHYRNPRAHASRLGSNEALIDLYDAFGLFSYVHRRLDTATTTRPGD